MGKRLAPAAPLRRWYLRACRSALIVAAATTLGTAALAQGAPADHAKLARTAYNLQDWPTAIREYQAAYAAEQRPELLFGLAQAQRQSGDFVAAIASFKAYKRAPSVTDTQATAAELLITKCEIEQSKKELEAKQKSEPPAAPPAAPAAPPPATAPAAPAVPPPPAEPKRFYQDAAGDVLFFGGLVIFGVGGGLLGVGNGQVSGSSSAATHAGYDQQISGGQVLQYAGVGLLAGGGALALGGALRWGLVGRSQPSDGKPASASFSVQPSVQPGVAGALLRGVF